jgi:hypothetical protein
LERLSMGSIAELIPALSNSFECYWSPATSSS